MGPIQSILTLAHSFYRYCHSAWHLSVDTELLSSTPPPSPSQFPSKAFAMWRWQVLMQRLRYSHTIAEEDGEGREKAISEVPLVPPCTVMEVE